LHTPQSTPPRSEILAFHKSLPTYGETPLVPLPEIGRELGLKGLYLKNERVRFGDLGFKSLGLAWAMRNAIVEELELKDEKGNRVVLDEIVKAVKERGKEQKLVVSAASDGIMGRIVARVAGWFGVEGICRRIFVPESASEEVRKTIREEGAEVLEVGGDLEMAVREAALHAVSTDGAFIDIEISEEYEYVPKESSVPSSHFLFLDPDLFPRGSPPQENG
jgi:diaminopropionate ammonia-lyase